MNLPASSFWIIHVFGCLAAGALAWGLGLRMQRWLGISYAARNYWLGLWLLAVAPAIVAVVLDVWAPPIVSLPMTLPLPAALDGMGMEHPAAAPAITLPGLAVWLAALYLAGVGVALLAQLRGALAVRRVLQGARPIAHARWPGPASATEARQLTDNGIALHMTTQAVSPFAVSWPRPVIVLPSSALQRFNDRQLHMVIRHEAAHLLPRDPQRAAWMRLAGAVLWFNPFVRLLAARVQMAAELRCDAWALQADSAAGRELASAYVDTLRMAGNTGHAATALAQHRLDDHRLRLRHMLGGDPHRALPVRLRVVFVATAVTLGGLLASMQAALADPQPRVAQASTATTASKPRFSNPVPTAQVSSHYRQAGNGQRAHYGIDFEAPRGTAVLASAAGTVVAATTDYPNGPRYGSVVVLDHGQGWQTLYAQLESFNVKPGQQIKAGDRIARIGPTGESTDSHVHVELLKDGQRVDPQALMR